MHTHMVGVISASWSVTVNGCVVVVLFNAGTGPAWLPAWHAHICVVSLGWTHYRTVSRQGSACGGGGGVIWTVCVTVSTEGLHAYTCMLTSIRPRLMVALLYPSVCKEDTQLESQCV